MEPAQIQLKRILVVDDHPMVRDGIAQLINHQTGLTCCAAVGSLAETRAAIAVHKPHLIILDLRLRSEDGLDFLKTLRLEHPDVAVLILSQQDQNIYAERALRAGAGGYLMKEQACEDVIRAIHTVLAGQVYVPEELATSLFHKLLRRSGNPSSDLGPLTDRELHVLRLIGSGMSTRQIAETLHLSPKTVATHRENLKRKLGLPNAAALVHFASRQNPGDATSSSLDPGK